MNPAMAATAASCLRRALGRRLDDCGLVTIPSRQPVLPRTSSFNAAAPLPAPILRGRSCGADHSPCPPLFPCRSEGPTSRLAARAGWRKDSLVLTEWTRAASAAYYASPLRAIAAKVQRPPTQTALQRLSLF